MEKTDQTLRVIHVYSGYRRKKGGIKQVLGELLREQNRLTDLKVWVYATKDEELFDNSGESQKAGISDLLDLEPNLIVFHSIYGDLVGFFRLTRSIRRAKIPYCIQPHGNLDNRAMEKSGLKKRIVNWVWVNAWVKKAEAVIYLCEEEHKASRLQGLEFSILPNAFPRPLVILESLPPINEETQLIMLSRIDPHHKGIDRFFQTLRQLPEETAQRIRIDLYGYGSDVAVRWMQRELESIKNCRIEYCGPVFGEEKKRVMEHADVFCMFSRYEGLPLTLYEAAASGLPVLVTEGSNRTEWVKEWKNGWVLWDCDEEEWGGKLADAIADYRKNPNLYKESAIRSARALPTWDEIARDSVEIYRKWGKKHDE